MAFAAKTDYCGLMTSTAFNGKIKIRDDADNASVEKYQPTGQDGSFIATEVYGEDAAPTNNYAFVADVSAAAGSVKLNAITVIGSDDAAKNYALEQFVISTSGGAAPTLAATCQLIEHGSSDEEQCHYSVPAFSLKKKNHAQDVFGAFTLSGAGCHLTECTATVGGSISKTRVAGETVASDIGQGVITVTGSVIQNGTVAPTVTANEGWVVTSALARTNAETAYPTYEFELQMILAKDKDADAS